MTLTTINPSTSGGSLGSGTVVGAADIQTALRDSSDDSYLAVGQTTHSEVDFPAPSLPGGSLIKAIVANARIAGVIGGFGDTLFGPGSITANLPDVEGQQTTNVNWANIRSIAIYTRQDLQTSAEVGTWQLNLKRVQSGAFEDPGDIRIYKLSFAVSYIAKPVVNVTDPDATITNTSFPLIDWDVTSQDADGGPVNVAQVRVFNDGSGAGGYNQAGFSPAGSSAFDETVLAGGSSSANTRWRVETKLPNDTYRAYVRVIQYGESNWSDWDFIQWDQNVTPPADPSSVVATADSANGRISIDVVGSDTPRSVDAVDIQRSQDGGTTWETLRGYGADDYIGLTPVSGEVVAYDFEAQMGLSTTYRARTVHHYALGEDAVSDWVTSNAVTWTSSSWWIKHPTYWPLNLGCVVRTQPSNIRARRQGIFAPMGRADPIVVQDTVRTLPSGDIGVRSLTDATKAVIDALADSDQAVLIQAPANNSWPDRWVKLGDQTSERIVDGFSQPWTVENFPWQEVAAPEGDYTVNPGTGPSGLTLPFTLSNSTLLH